MAIDDLKTQERSLQDYLSLGYLYLLVLGILKDSIAYSFLGINIFKYSSLIDVLLSPLKTIFDSLLVFVCVVVLAGFSYWYHQNRLKIHNYFRDKKWYQKAYDVEKYDKIYAENKNPIEGFVVGMAIFFMCFFLGFGLGGGSKFAQKVENGTLEADHRLVFEDKESLNVNIIGQNSQYIFYVLDKGTQLTAVPISGNIKKIEILKKED